MQILLSRRQELPQKCGWESAGAGKQTEGAKVMGFGV
jgi:hypothetical protein